MGTTNYTDTFIQVADDCPVTEAEVPPEKPRSPSIAALQHALISAHPYELTSDDVLFEVHRLRQQADAGSRDDYFAKDRACLRSSPLSKRYGWGVHHDTHGHVALVAVESQRYAELAADTSLRQTKAMRSKRA